MKNILILGGTQFIGRYLVEKLIELDEYELTLFNRLRTKPELFPNLTRIKGDRETNDINQLTTEYWDVIIDLSCYYPESLANILSALDGKFNQYILVSTCSVYDNENNREVLKTEKATVKSCTSEQRVDRTDHSYGNRKAECERILLTSGVNSVIIRPSLVYGPYDHTDRFYYWLYQVKHSHKLLLPDNGQRCFSLTYVGDLVETILQSLKQPPQQKIYNVTTIPQASIAQIVECAQELLDKNQVFINASPSFLHQHKISQWGDMPLWIDGDYFTYSNQELIDDLKIELSSISSSIVATINYYKSIDWPSPAYGMTEKVRLGLIEKMLPNREND